MVAGVAVLGTLLVGCGDDADNEEAGRPHIMATTSVWANVVGEIVGENGTVSVLIPAGGDAHDYEATPQQVASVQEADLVVANGLGLEAGVEAILEGAASDGVKVLEVAPDLDPLPFADRGHEDGEAHGDDPHVWLDPARVATATRLIADALVEVDDSVDWHARAASYSDELLEADQTIARILEVVPESDRKMVTNHDAFGYFADRYGFEVIAVVIPGGSTLGDPSSAEMAALVREIEQEDVRTIFAETTQPTRLAETVAAEAGHEVSVVELYTESLGAPGSDADTLIGMLTTNARRIAEALAP